MLGPGKSRTGEWDSVADASLAGRFLLITYPLATMLCVSLGVWPCVQDGLFLYVFAGRVAVGCPIVW